MAGDCRFNPLEPGFGIHLTCRQRADREARPLVEILMIGFDHQHLVPVSDPLDKTADRTALGFQASRLRNVEIHVGDDVFFSGLGMNEVIIGHHDRKNGLPASALRRMKPMARTFVSGSKAS